MRKLTSSLGKGVERMVKHTPLYSFLIMLRSSLILSISITLRLTMILKEQFVVHGHRRAVLLSQRTLPSSNRYMMSAMILNNSYLSSPQRMTWLWQNSKTFVMKFYLMTCFDIFMACISTLKNLVLSNLSSIRHSVGLYLSRKVLEPKFVVLDSDPSDPLKSYLTIWNIPKGYIVRSKGSKRKTISKKMWVKLAMKKLTSNLWARSSTDKAF